MSDPAISDPAGSNQSVVTSDERTMGTLAHVLQLVGGWIAPLVIFLVKRNSRFVSFHALQALLLQGLYFVLMMVVMGAFFCLCIRRRCLSPAGPEQFFASRIHHSFPGDLVGNDGMVGVYVDRGHRVRNQSGAR